ncbi:MAG: hypothetical protein AAGL49_07695 [Pseudomonadota bacterium]
MACVNKEIGLVACLGLILIGCASAAAPAPRLLTSDDVNQLRELDRRSRKEYDDAAQKLAEMGFELNPRAWLVDVVDSYASKLDDMLDLGASIFANCEVGDCSLSDIVQRAERDGNGVSLVILYGDHPVSSYPVNETDFARRLLFAYGLERVRVDNVVNLMRWSHIDKGSPYYSDDVALIDFERINVQGDYSALLKRMLVLTDGGLEIEPVRDFFRVEDLDGAAAEAWLEYSDDGEVIRWNFEVNYDWVDPSFFVLFDQLLAAKQAEAALWSFNDGQSDLFFVASESRANEVADYLKMELRGWRGDRPGNLMREYGGRNDH